MRRKPYTLGFAWDAVGVDDTGPGEEEEEEEAEEEPVEGCGCAGGGSGSGLAALIALIAVWRRGAVRV